MVSHHIVVAASHDVRAPGVVRLVLLRDEIVVEQGVTILGPTNLPSTVPYHASQMYAKNITTFLLHLVKDGNVRIDASDEITHDTLIAEKSEVVNPRIREALGLPALVGTT